MHPPTEINAHSLCLPFTVLETYFLASSSSFSLASSKAQAQARLLNLRPPRERGVGWLAAMGGGGGGEPSDLRAVGLPSSLV